MKLFKLFLLIADKKSALAPNLQLLQLAKVNHVNLTLTLVRAQSHNCGSSIPKIIEKDKKLDRGIFCFKYIMKNLDSVSRK
jgi:hypothetical protein